MCGLYIAMLHYQGLGCVCVYIAMLHFPGLGYVWFSHSNVTESRARVCVICTDPRARVCV